MAEKDELVIEYCLLGKAQAPRPMRLQVPGWAGLPDQKMENGHEPQPWHCRPFVDAATSGFELIYQYDTECQVLNEGGTLRIIWDPRAELGGGPIPTDFGIFDTRPHRYYVFRTSVDMKCPPGYVMQTQPHPRFYTDMTGTVPLALIGQLESEWWPKPLVIFKAPPPGQRHIFRKGEPYVQILFIRQNQEYQPQLMTEEQTKERANRRQAIGIAASYVANNVWHHAEGSQFNNHYKVMSRAFRKGGFAELDRVLAEGIKQRQTEIPLGRDLKFYLDLAMQYQSQGKHMQACDIYASVLRQDPNNAEVVGRFGVLAVAMGLPEFAANLFSQAARLQPQSPAHLANLGEVLRRMGRFSDAERALRASLQINPNDAQVLSNLGQVMARQGHVAQGLELCRTALGFNQHQVLVHHRMGAIYCETGQLDQARASYKSALALDPNDAVAQRRLSELPESSPVSRG